LGPSSGNKTATARLRRHRAAGAHPGPSPTKVDPRVDGDQAIMRRPVPMKGRGERPMSVVMWVLVALLTGLLAGFARKHGSYGC
jgi:hypothetical protein